MNEGFQINCRDGAPILAAIKAGRYNILRYLIKAGAELNFEDGHVLYRSLIQKQSGHYDIRIPKLLIASGAKPELMSNTMFENIARGSIENILLLAKMNVKGVGICMQEFGR